MAQRTVGSPALPESDFPWVPVLTIVIVLVFLYNVLPKLVTYTLILILILLIINRWDRIKRLYQ